MANDTNEKKKILMVDDDVIHLTTAELFLKDEYEIIKMKSGDEALEYVNNNKFVPHIILLDIMMPNMDGWEVLKRIKAIDFLKKVPIIFLTAVEEEMDMKKAFKMGVADYIMKPFNMTNLKGRIKDALKKA